MDYVREAQRVKKQEESILLRQFSAKDKVTGIKQSLRAVRSGLAREVFLAHDADPALTAPLLELCRQKEIPIVGDFSMAQLGQAAGIQVGAAVVALLK